jgi:dolichol kinase
VIPPGGSAPPVHPTPWRAELGRKGVHLASVLFPVSWALGWVDRTIILAVLVAGLVIAVVLEVGRRRSGPIRRWFDAWFGWMLRAHEATALTGATWILAAMCLAAWLLPPAAAITALWAAVVGDASAALVGRTAAARAAAQGKTWAGSVACVVASALGPVLLVGATLPTALAIGAAAALGERPRHWIDDNARVAAAAGLAAWLLLAR